MKKDKLINLIFPLVLFVSVLVVYISTAAVFHVSFGDSDEFNLIGYTLGVAHAPGYPVYILLLFIATHVIPFGTITWRASFVSVICDTCTIFFFYLVSRDMLLFLSKQSNLLLHSFISLFASLMLAFSLLFWFYTNMPEVFALNNLFLIFLIFCSIRLTILCFEKKAENTQKEITRYIIILFIAAGLGLGHLQTIILLYPVITIYCIYILKKTNWFKFRGNIPLFLVACCIGFIAFFLPFLLLFWYNNIHASVSWQFHNTLSNLFSYILRQQYTDQNLGIVSAYSGSTNFSQSIGSIIPYFGSIMSDFSLFPLLFIICGMVYVWIKSRKLALYLTALFLTGGVFFAMYAVYPPSDPKINIFNTFANIAIVQRQYIMGDIVLALFIPLGLYASYVGISSLLIDDLFKLHLFKYIFVITKSVKAASVILCFSLGILIFEYISNYSQANLHNFSYMQEYAHDALQSTKKNALIICFSDIICNAYFYEQIVDHTRPDDIIVPYNYALRPSYLNSIDSLQKFFYPYSPYVIGDIVSWNMYNHRPVYVADVTDDYASFLGLNGGAYFLIPNGYLHELSYINISTTTNYSYKTLESLHTFLYSQAGGSVSRNYWYLALSGYLTRPLMLDAYDAWQEGNRNQAEKIIATEHNLNTDFETQKAFAALDTLYTHKKSGYAQNQSVLTAADFIQRAQEEKNVTQALFDAQFATFEDPLNIQARLLLASIYAKAGATSIAHVEYEHVLTIDPHNTIANEKLK